MTLIAEVETDKATMEFRPFDKGALLKQLAPGGSHPAARINRWPSSGKQGDDIAAAAQAGGGGASHPALPAASKPAQRRCRRSPRLQRRSGGGARPKACRGGERRRAACSVCPWCARSRREREIDLSLGAWFRLPTVA